MLGVLVWAISCHGAAQTPLTSNVIPSDRTVSRLAFGSCYAPQLEASQIWQRVADRRPQVLLLAGDNVYQSAETGNPALRELREAYAMLAADQPFSRLRRRTQVLATWDDHDYGLDNAGAEFPARTQSEALFEAVWPAPRPDGRDHREGVYTAMTWGAPGRRLQVILLDTRFFRGRWPKLETVDRPDDPSTTMLGEAQWTWLEETLRKPAELRVLVSSIPVLTERQEGESWRGMPAERRRLLDLIDRADRGRVLILSGDAHFAAHFSDVSSTGPELHEVLSSSLNLPISTGRRASLMLDDAARRSPVLFDANFGLLDIDWEAGRWRVRLIDDSGVPRFALVHEFAPSRIQPSATRDPPR